MAVITLSNAVVMVSSPWCAPVLSCIIRNKCGHCRASLASRRVTQCGSVKEPKWLRRYLEAQATDWWEPCQHHSSPHGGVWRFSIAVYQISTNSRALKTHSCQLSPGPGVLAQLPWVLFRAVIEVLSSVTWGQVKVGQLLYRFLRSVVLKPLASVPVLTRAFPLLLEASDPTRPLSWLS